jgi:hypothetical protein
VVNVINALITIPTEGIVFIVISPGTIQTWLENGEKRKIINKNICKMPKIPLISFMISYPSLVILYVKEFYQASTS